MTDDRQTRGDSFEARLSPEQRDLLYERLLQRFDPGAVGNWAAKEFEVEAPGRSALYRFRAAWRPEYENRRDQRVLLSCQTVDSLLAKEPQISDATRAQARTLALEAAMRGDYDAGQRWAALAERITRERGGMVELDLKIKEFEHTQREFDLKKQDMDLKLRKLNLLETKLQEASATGATVDPKQLADEIDRVLGRKS